MASSDTTAARGENAKAGGKKNSRFDDILAGLPEAFRSEIIQTDGFLKSMRPLKFKRSIDKFGNKITYVAADYGVSYAFRVAPEQNSHELNWYIVYNGKPETWHRKADFMEETLDEIAKTDPRLSERIFNALVECTHCQRNGCLAKTPYFYNGQGKLCCHGRVTLSVCANDFADARMFFEHLNRLVERKIANGDPPPERIILMRTKHSL